MVDNSLTDIVQYFDKYGFPYTTHYYEMHKDFMQDLKIFFKRNIISINDGRKKKEKIRIHLYEINNFDLNASALKVGDKDYTVIIRSGVFEIIHNEIGQNFEIFQEITETYYEDLGETVGLYYLFVYAYLIGHELGHITQGHHSIARTSNLSENIEIFDVSNNNQNSHPLYNRYLLELDADFYAVSFILKLIYELKVRNLIYTHAKNKKFKNKKFESKMVYNDINAVIRIVITAIYLTHNLFAKKHNYKSDYPEPHIRTGFMIYHLKHNIGKVIKENEDVMKSLCEVQMEKIYDIQDKYLLSAFKISSFEDFNKNIEEKVVEHLNYYKKLEYENVRV